ELYVSKFAHVRFEPHGFTKNSDIPIAKSIVDYLFRWLGIKFLGHAPASAAHEAAKDDPLEAHGVQPVSDNQLSLINGIQKAGEHKPAPPKQGNQEGGRAAGRGGHGVRLADGRPAVHGVRGDHGPAGSLLLLPQLRRDERLQLIEPRRRSGAGAAAKRTKKRA